MKRFLFIAFVFLFMMFLFVGCGVASYQDSATEEFAVAPRDGASNAFEKEIAHIVGYADGRGFDSDSTSVTMNEHEDFESRKVIQNAEYRIEVERIEERIREIESEVLAYGGFLGESNISNDGNNRYWANMLIRIPQENFEVMLEYLDEIGKVRDRRVYVDDVTMKFTDLEVRLKVLKAEEDSLLEILSKADEVEDVLNVRRELRSVRADIESMEGELKYLTNRIDFSSINLNLQQVANIESGIDATGFSGLWGKGAALFIKNVNAILNLLANAAVAFMGSLPIILPVALFFGLIFALVYKKNRNIETQKRK